jgi:hypothetical protein
MTDDLERDQVLHQRIHLFSWIKEEHFDISTGEGSQGFIGFAQRGTESPWSLASHPSIYSRFVELLNINHYKAPRDKLICILNCCKVVFGTLTRNRLVHGADRVIGLLRHFKVEENADAFLPVLIFVVLKANPDNLISNIECGCFLLPHTFRMRISDSILKIHQSVQKS